MAKIIKSKLSQKTYIKKNNIVVKIKNIKHKNV